MRASQCLQQETLNFAKHYDKNFQDHLSRSHVDWTLLELPKQLEAEAMWRSIYGQTFRRRPRIKRAVKAEYEYQLQACSHFLIVPFSSNVEGFAMSVQSQTLSAYECRGNLLPLGEFCQAEFFIAPLDFEWTMVHTHEDHGFGGPFFIRRDWIWENEPY